MTTKKPAFLFIFLTYACTNAHIHAGDHRGQKKVLDPLELELQAAAKC